MQVNSESRSSVLFYSFEGKQTEISNSPRASLKMVHRRCHLNHLRSTVLVYEFEAFVERSPLQAESGRHGA